MLIKDYTQGRSRNTVPPLTARVASVTPDASVQGKRPLHGRTKACEDSRFVLERPIG